jgi:lipopolysaccharide export system protein LptC
MERTADNPGEAQRDPATRVAVRRAARPSAPHGRSAAYGDAVRNSSRVRFLRRVLLAVAGIMVLVAGTLAWLDPFRFLRDLPVDLTKLSISGNKLVMDAPKLSGFTKDGRGYSIMAKSAAQDLTKTNVIELSEIIANFSLAANAATELKAAKGVYDAKADRVQLTEGIQIDSSSGYKGKLHDALIEVKRGYILTENPIDFIFNEGTLRADRMEIFDNGARAVFQGRVQLVTRLPGPDETTATVTAPVPQANAEPVARPQ